MKDYRAKYPDKPELQPRADETYAAPQRYNSTRGSLPQLLRRGAHAAAGRRRCRVRPASCGTGAARQPQLLREPRDRLERRQDGADRDRVALMTRLGSCHASACRLIGDRDFARGSRRRESVRRSEDAQPGRTRRLARSLLDVQDDRMRCSSAFASKSMPGSAGRSIDGALTRVGPAYRHPSTIRTSLAI